MLARPYAQMISTVLESLVRRTDLYDDETGDVLHPLLVEREEKNVLVIVVAGDKGFAARSTRTSSRRRKASSMHAGLQGRTWMLSL